MGPLQDQALGGQFFHYCLPNLCRMTTEWAYCYFSNCLPLHNRSVSYMNFASYIIKTNHQCLPRRSDSTANRIGFLMRNYLFIIHVVIEIDHIILRRTDCWRIVVIFSGCRWKWGWHGLHHVVGIVVDLEGRLLYLFHLHVELGRQLLQLASCIRCHQRRLGLSLRSLIL